MSLKKKKKDEKIYFKILLFLCFWIMVKAVLPAGYKLSDFLLGYEQQFLTNFSWGDISSIIYNLKER